ncbi:carbon monoxide dehydrogenase subunit G [Pigmentiphaga soli]|uniref:Carbon monoxide dehydrogenase subunit G n=1 Tax=Pigmentiphaga soli TaxID=1007095 RepID=A0ABP8HCS8_9BURK
MDLTGSRLVPGSQQRTWNKLIAPETLKVCIPGCEKVERVADDEYKVSMHADVGPVSAHFDGRIKLSDIRPPHSYHLEFEGEGPAAGGARGYADVRLTPEGDNTRLSYAAHADLQGKLAGLRGDQAEKIARKMSDRFLGLLSLCASRAAEQAEAPHMRRFPAMAGGGSPSHNGELFSRFSWVIAGGIVLLLVAYHILFR